MSDERSTLFTTWWRSLDDDRGGRSELRRCGSPADVVLIPAFHRLYRVANGAGFSNPDRVAVAAAVLAHVRADQGGHSFADVIAGTVSEARFRRLLTIDSIPELQQALIRTVRMNHAAAPIEALGRDIQFWGDAVRKRWAFDYYQKEQKESAS